MNNYKIRLLSKELRNRRKMRDFSVKIMAKYLNIGMLHYKYLEKHPDKLTISQILVINDILLILLCLLISQNEI